MSLSVGDRVYIKTNNKDVIYDRDETIYIIKNIHTHKVIIEDGYGNQSNEEITNVTKVPNLQINKVNIADAKKKGENGLKNIKKVKKSEGKYEYQDGVGYKPQYPNRLEYTLDDTPEVVYEDDDKITDVAMN